MGMGAGVSNELRVTFFGDSICVGQYVALHKGWVTQTSSELSVFGRTRGWRILVSNASANGRTTRLALEAMPYEVQSHAPDIVLVQFGLNDCNRWESDKGLARVSERAFAANLEEIVQRATHFGAKQIILHTNHPTLCDQKTLANSGITLEDGNRRYNDLIRKVAERAKRSAVLCDFESVFLQATAGDRDRLAELLLADGLHLSEAGHALYFSTLYPEVRRRVEVIIDDANTR